MKKTAQESYNHSVQEAAANLRRLLAHVEAKAANTSADWGDAGDVAQINEDIKHIAQRTFHEGEYAN